MHSYPSLRKKEIKIKAGALIIITCPCVYSLLCATRRKLLQNGGFRNGCITKRCLHNSGHISYIIYHILILLPDCSMLNDESNKNVMVVMFWRILVFFWRVEAFKTKSGPRYEAASKQLHDPLKCRKQRRHVLLFFSSIFFGPDVRMDVALRLWHVALPRASTFVCLFSLIYTHVDNLPAFLVFLLILVCNQTFSWYGIDRGSTLPPPHAVRMTSRYCSTCETYTEHTNATWSKKQEER